MTEQSEDQGNSAEDKNVSTENSADATIENEATPSDEEIEAQADADFASGFNKVNGTEEEEAKPVEKPTDQAEPNEDPVEKVSDAADDDKTKQDAEVVDSDQTTDQAAAASTGNEGATDEQEVPLEKRVRKIEAYYGGLMTKMDQLLTGMKTPDDKDDSSGPSPEELRAALKDPEKMAGLISRYEDFAPVQDELAHIHQKIGENVITEEQIDSIVNQRMEAQRLEEAHEGWKETMGTDQFRSYCLDGGPTSTEFDVVSAREKDAYEQTNPELRRQGLDFVNAELKVWSEAHPEWWEEKGSDIFSSKAKDTIRLFDGYSSHISAQDSQNTQKEEARIRLKNALRPKTVSGQVSTGTSDEDAFANGFDKVKKSTSLQR